MKGDGEFQILDAEMWKACELNDRLCHGTERSWVEDERVDFLGL